MRKIRQFFLTTAAVLCSTLTTWAAYNGTPAAPTQISGNYADYGLSADFDGYYVISTAAELYGFAELVNGGTTSANAVLTANIEVNENVLKADGTLNGTPTYSWTPIGTFSKKYTGTFDGNGHTISGLYFNNTTNSYYPDGGNNVGLIGSASSATIKNVGVIDSYLKGRDYVGGICGFNGKITNCHNTGTVSGSKYVGGICGSSGTQTNCYNTGTVSGSSSNVGGICGYAGTLTNCYNTGTVSGSSDRVGGICGYAGTLTNCYNTGTVSGTSNVGGLCGESGTLTNCYNTGTVLGNSFVGGICGYGGTQRNCYYLAGCAKDGKNVVQYGVGNAKGRTTADEAGKTTAATAEKFASGEITYLLNGSTSEGDLVWYQTLGVGNDAYPVFDNTHAVVYATQPCPSFSNDASKTHKEHQSTDDVTGYCTTCGQFAAQGSLVTESNYSSLNLSADFVGYYAISNSGELYWFANEVNNGNTAINAVLTDNIVVNENVLKANGTLNSTPTYSWTPIGTSAYNYAGTFDGNGHTISGLFLNNTNKSYVGLIGYANGATIKNVGVIDSYLKGNQYAGGICGYGSNSTITNCYNTGTVSVSDSYVGGICGYSGTITNCHNTGRVSGSYQYSGGICGYSGTITNCYNTGTLSGTMYNVGGICGSNGTQTNCYNTGTVYGSSVGGICGYGGTQRNCYYLAGCCSVSSGGVSATAEKFASGEITYLLNGSTSEGDLVWYQTLGVGNDAYPVFDNTHAVVYATQPCTSFSNDASKTHKEHQSTDDVTGQCTACGQFFVQGTWVTASNYSGLNLTADFVGYYAINNSGELYWFASEVNNGSTNIKAVLTADIVVNENVLNADGTLNGTPTYSWTPIGTSSQKYAGTFDGNGHTISGLYFNNSTNIDYPNGGNYVGLIGYAKGATIKNVGVINSYLRGNQYVGGICGYGSNTDTKITNCYNTGTLSGSSWNVGGICGRHGTITNCHNTGTVSGSSSEVGGICGGSGTQTNCYNIGTVSGSSSEVGGICGTDGTQTNCYNTGTVSASGSNAGGICGGGISTQTNCYYLEGCAIDGNNVVQFGVGSSTKGNTNADVVGKTTAATAEEFASGKIGYLLNNDNNNAWYQDLYSDGYPLLDNTHNLVSGYIEEVDDTYTVVGDVLLATNYEIAEGETLNVPIGTTLTTTGNAVITNNGTLRANGTLAGNNLAGNGTFITNRVSLCSISNLDESYVYKSTAYTLEDGLSGVAVNTTILGKTFTLDATISSPSYTNNRNAGTATISWTNTADANDVLSREFEITPKEINLVWSNAQFTYNRTAQAPSATATGMVGNDACEVTVSGAQTNAGSYTATAESLSNTNYKLPEDKTKAFNISPKTITVTATAESREYDSSIDAEGSLSTADIISGDNVTISYANAEFNNKNVGAGKVVTFSGITIGGTSSANYALSSTSVTANANITAKGLNLSNFAASDKTYDGTTNATGGSFSDDRVSGDALEFSFDYAFADKNAANAVAVNFSNIAISGGADKDNYTLAATTGAAKADITVKTLAISNIKAENKTYDGNTTTSVSYTTDKVATDDVTFGTTATFADKNVGNGKAVSFNYTKSGADAANYAFANESGSTTANITARTLTLSNFVADGKTYDGTTNATGGSFSDDRVSGDVLDFTYDYSFENKNAGTNKNVNFSNIAISSGADKGNYTLAATTGTAKANITAKGLTLNNFTAGDKTFDGTTNATGGAFSDDRVSGDALEFSFNYAFANMNAANAVAVNFSNIAISGGADKDNYTLLTTTGTCSAKISPVTDEVVLNFTMPTRTVMYNGQANRYEMPTADELFSTNNELYRMYGGFQPADNDAFQAARANVLAQTEVGEYTFGYNSGTLVNTSANFTNVTFNVTDGKLIITPKTGVVVTITENSGELAYNTEEQSVEGYTYSIDDELGIYSEDDFAFSGNAVVAGTTVGTYTMELSAADFSNTNANFAEVEFVIVDGALTITKAPEAPNKPAAAMETRYIVTQLVALPENWKWADEQQALEEGSNVATANYVGADKGNYVIESVDVTITRLECLHNEGNEVLYTLEPTCTHKGYTGNLSCKLCGEIYEMGDSIPALGHDFVETVVAPTCTTDGYTTHFCARDNYTEYSDTVPATGHKEDVAVFENIVAATCTEAGSKDSVVYCSVCHVELSRTVLEIPATGHKDSVVIENIVRPTLEAAGSYDSVVYCSVCKVELSRKTIDVLASAVAVSKLPNKVEYKQGEALDVKGGKITATYSDESTAEFEMLAGWVSGFDPEKVGKQTLTVKFETVSSTLTTTFDVTVNAKDDNTAIDEDAAEISIYAYSNIIVVEAADAITGEIAVFDVNGRMVRKTLAAGTRTEIQMQRQGLYIVRYGNQAKRVVIK